MTSDSSKFSQVPITQLNYHKYFHKYLSQTNITSWGKNIITSTYDK